MRVGAGGSKQVSSRTAVSKVAAIPGAGQRIAVLVPAPSGGIMLTAPMSGRAAEGS